MKLLELKYVLLLWLANLSLLIITVMPFHAFLTVWLSTVVGHYTALRLWKEGVLAILIIGIVVLVLTDKKIRAQTFQRRLVWVITAYLAWLLISGALSYHAHQVTLKALGYGLVVDSRYLIFFLITWAIALRTHRMRVLWRQLILWPAAVVVIFGLLQIFVLPRDFLHHFGYGPNTIAPYQTVNSNLHYVRIESTLRGVNPLGAYLALILSFLTVQLMQKKRDRDWRHPGFFIAGWLVLFFTFSRSALFGALIGCLVAFYLGLHTRVARLRLLYSALAVVAVGGLLFATVHNNQRVQNIVLHTQTHSAVSATSDQGHLAGIRNGTRDIIHNPLGKGPGTAGPASVYNAGKARIAEDYYIQIGQETGVIGLALFAAINVGIGYLLWLRRADLLALSLLASLIGISVIGLFLHVWSDDTLAYIWWGLAGIAMTPNLKEARQQADDSLRQA